MLTIVYAKYKFLKVFSETITVPSDKDSEV